MNTLQQIETALSTRRGANQYFDGQTECAAYQAEHSNPEAGFGARLLPRSEGEISSALGMEPNRETDVSKSTGWRNQADGFFE